MWLRTAVLTFACLVSDAHAQVWGNSQLDGGFQIANIGNDANYITGVVCGKGLSCSDYLLTPIPCEVKSTYPMMINSPVGAFLITSTCVAIGDLKVLQIDQFDSAVAAYKSGGEIGFAVPLLSGRFNVVRFSTAGATAAIDRTIAASKQSNAPPTSPGANRMVGVQTL